MMQNDGTAYRSDENGHYLPPLPSDAELKITVTHPEWAVGVIENVVVSELHKTPVQLIKGTTVEAYFCGTPEALKSWKAKR